MLDSFILIILAFELYTIIVLNLVCLFKHLLAEF